MMDPVLSTNLDHLRDLFAVVEEKFVSKGFVVRASVSLLTELGLTYRLAFGKISQTYKLILETWRGSLFVNQEQLKNVGIKFRLLAPDKIGELYTALQVAMADQANIADEQVQKMERFLVELDLPEADSE
jgi:hypothetical protein